METNENAPILTATGLKKTFRLSRKQWAIEKTDSPFRIAVDGLSFTANRGAFFFCGAVKKYAAINFDIARIGCFKLVYAPEHRCFAAACGGGSHRDRRYAPLDGGHCRRTVADTVAYGAARDGDVRVEVVPRGDGVLHQAHAVPRAVGGDGRDTAVARVYADVIHLRVPAQQRHVHVGVAACHKLELLQGIDGQVSHKTVF